MDNRRRMQRHILSYNLPVTNTRTGKRIGFLIDITPEGLLLVGEQPFIANETIHVRIEAETTGEEPIAIDAVCRWCTRDARKTLWKAGFIVSDEHGRESEKIVRLICKLGV